MWWFLPYIVLILFVCSVIYFHIKLGKPRDTYPFQGLIPNEEFYAKENPEVSSDSDSEKENAMHKVIQNENYFEFDEKLGYDGLKFMHDNLIRGIAPQSHSSGTSRGGRGRGRGGGGRGRGGSPRRGGRGRNQNSHLSGLKYSNRKTTPSSKKEEACRRILENIYHRPFNSHRPDFLKNPITNKNLELDCYNEDLKISLEYDGGQHSKYTPAFHGDNKWNFIYQVRKDDFKNKVCKEQNITLIRVPHHIPEYKLEEYIKDKLRKAGKL